MGDNIVLHNMAVEVKEANVGDTKIRGEKGQANVGDTKN